MGQIKNIDSEKLRKYVQRKIDRFNKKLDDAIEELDGLNSFYWPAGENTIVGDSDPIQKAHIVSIDEVQDDDDEHIEWEVVVSVDGDNTYVEADDTGWVDSDSLDDDFKYLNRRIKRTLRIERMSPEQMNREFDKELEGKCEEEDEEE